MKYQQHYGRSVSLVIGVLVCLLGLPGAAWAAEGLDSGDTAWILTSMALVLFMTIPGLSLFYAGLVRRRNVLSVLMQCFALTALVSVIWVIYGYTLTFGTGGMEAGVINLHSCIGDLRNLFLVQVKADSLSGTIPETVFVAFQMTFAIITPALICGAYAERMRFSAVLWFSGLWLTLVYIPICHMAWAGDGALFANWGAMDFAGGAVVHINAGVAALLACILIGKREGYPKALMPPHNLTMTITGAGMLWVGWFGFNAGSALAANGSAGMAMLVTQVSAATATLTWMAIEWIKHGKPSALGAVTGAIAGLATITPAAGSCGPLGALVIGFLAGALCFVFATTIKQRFGYDDSLDAFGVHGVGGLLGTLLTGVFAAESLGGQGMEHASIAGQVLAQVKMSAVTIGYCGLVSFILLKGLDWTLGLRVRTEEERQGLDLTQHEEEGYIL